jgi:hypothetical protein
MEDPKIVRSQTTYVLFAGPARRYSLTECNSTVVRRNTLMAVRPETFVTQEQSWVDQARLEFGLRLSRGFQRANNLRC